MNDADYVRALGLGVCGIFLKHSSPELLVEAIHKVMAGETWIDQRCVQGLVMAVENEGRHARKNQLSERERDVLKGVFAGSSNKGDCCPPEHLRGFGKINDATSSFSPRPESALVMSWFASHWKNMGPRGACDPRMIQMVPDIRRRSSIVKSIHRRLRRLENAKPSTTWQHPVPCVRNGQLKALRNLLPRNCPRSG